MGDLIEFLLGVRTLICFMGFLMWIWCSVRLVGCLLEGCMCVNAARCFGVLSVSKLLELRCNTNIIFCLDFAGDRFNDSVCFADVFYSCCLFEGYFVSVGWLQGYAMCACFLEVLFVI